MIVYHIAQSKQSRQKEKTLGYHERNSLKVDLVYSNKF